MCGIRDKNEELSKRSWYFVSFIPASCSESFQKLESLETLNYILSSLITIHGFISLFALWIVVSEYCYSQ